MSNCAVVDSNGLVVNIIVAETTDVPPEGCTLVLIPFCDIGYIWNGENFIPPVVTHSSITENTETTETTDPNQTVDS